MLLSENKYDDDDELRNKVPIGFNGMDPSTDPTNHHKRHPDPVSRFAIVVHFLDRPTDTHTHTHTHTHTQMDRWDKRQVCTNSAYALLTVSDALTIPQNSPDRRMRSSPDLDPDLGRPWKSYRRESLIDLNKYHYLVCGCIVFDCGRTCVRTDGRTDIFTGFIRSSLKKSTEDAYTAVIRLSFWRELVAGQPARYDQAIMSLSLSTPALWRPSGGRAEAEVKVHTAAVGQQHVADNALRVLVWPSSRNTTTCSFLTDIDHTSLLTTKIVLTHPGLRCVILLKVWTAKKPSPKIL